MRVCELSPAGSKISGEGGEGSAPGARAVIPLQTGEGHGEAAHGGPQRCRFTYSLWRSLTPS